MSNDTSYSKSFEELQEIVAQIEEGSIGIDELSAKVKKAAELIKICKTKLHSTEEDVQQILKDLESTKNQ